MSTLLLNRQTEENLWQLPIFDTHREGIKSKFADISNQGDSPYGGASYAAAVLEKFVDKDVKWAHIDLSLAYSNTQDGIYSPGVTGEGTQLIVRYLLNNIKKTHDKIAQDKKTLLKESKNASHKENSEDNVLTCDYEAEEELDYKI
jgi:hypothetical protein